MIDVFVGYENLPNIYITDIYLHDNTTTDYLIDIGLCLMDVNNSGESIWSSNPEFRKYIKVGFIKTTSLEMQEQLTNGNVSPHPSLIIKSKFWGFSSDIEVHTLHEFSKNTESGQVKFSKRVKFTSDYSTQTLSVFAYVFLDTQEISNDYEIELSGILKEYTGALVSEKIIENKNPVPHTNLFLRPDRTVYPGPVHYHSDKGYMEGSFHSDRQHNQLELLRIKNYKLVDNRQEKFELRHDKLSGNNTLFSDLYYSINDQVDLYGLFSFNLKRFIIQETEYGRKLYQLNNNFFNEYMKKIKINSLSITRQQITLKTAYNALGTLKNYSDNIGTHESLGNTLDNAEGRLIEVDNIREVFLDSNSLVRHFQFFDTKQNSKSKGIYRYSMELSIVDKSQIFVEEKISELELGMNRLQELVFKYNSPGNYDYSKNTLKKNVEMQSEIVDIIKQYYLKKSYLDTIPENKIVELVEKDLKKFLTGNYRATAGNSFLNEYKKLIKRFRDKFNIHKGYKKSKDKPKTIKSGNIPNLITLKKQFDPIIDFEDYRRFYDFLNINKEIRSPITKQEYFNRGAMEIDRFFDQSKGKDSLDFKEIPSKITKPLKQFKKASLMHLSPVKFQYQNEVVKLEHLDKVDSKNLFRVFNDSNERERRKRNKRRNIFANLRMDNRATNNRSTRKKEKINKPFANLRSRAFAYQLKKPNKSVQQIQRQYNIGSNIYLGNDSEFPFIDDRVDNPAFSRFKKSLERSLTSALDYSVPRTKNKFDVSRPNNYIDDFIKSKRPSFHLLEKAPICWKALIMSTTPSARNNIVESERDVLQDSTSKVATEMIFQTSQVVEMLAGYQRDKDGMLILSSPIWVEFNENMLSDTTATVCRLRYLEVPRLGITPLEMFKLPVINSTFIISERPLTSNAAVTVSDPPILDSDSINNIGSKNEISKNLSYARSNIVTQIDSKDPFKRSLDPESTSTVMPTQDSLIDMPTVNNNMASSPTPSRSRRRAPSSRSSMTGGSNSTGGGYSGGGGGGTGGGY